MILTLIIHSFLSFGSDVGEKEVLTQLQSEPKKSSSRFRTRGTSSTLIVPKAEKININSLRASTAGMSALEDPVIRPKAHVKSHAIQAVVGDIFNCRIYQDIIAYAGSVSPVRAEILEGAYKGYYFVGNATMDPKTKNVLVQFHTIRSPSADAIVRITATVHSSTGELGLTGTVTSHYWQYFFASVLASAAEGYAEATVQRQQNLFGNYQNVPTTETAGKKGVAEGAAQTADVMAEKMKSAPEFTTVRGPINTMIFIIDDVKT